MGSLAAIDYSKVKLVIFDLDGTLYEDDDHFEYYAEQLKHRLPEHLQASFSNDYNQAKDGKLPLQIGRVYDQQKDWIFVQKAGEIEEVYDWKGDAVDTPEWQRVYGEGWQIDFERIFSIGDSWWIPNAIARHYGLGADKSHEAFIATRELMMKPEFRIAQIPRLAETIQKLQSEYGWITVLMTNSPEIDSRVILQKLGLESYFAKFIFRARKPVRTKEIVQSLSEQFHVGYSKILSIGDNLINEILPVIQLGGQGIHINIGKISEEFLEPAPRVDSMTEIIEDLEKRHLI
ncbi:HAD family hydrolase [Fodinisporobacter ferrooxydans]|uniref:HAD family hydrolase n=1 Tax=Fodinisporobacter ferrooxydans TaxID=2901836 RepID=A0ABY4CNY5_9BACL|nr:HAD family hydrolase [Alicyclobacillaceae bacterium MYW30-H2]